MALFLVSGVIGVALMLVSVLFGDHDVGGHDGHDGGIFSVFTVSWFLVGFGGVGTLMQVNGYPVGMSTLGGVGIGVLCWCLAFGLMQMMRKQQGDSMVTSSRLLNTLGVVTIEIPSNSVGKIVCDVAGGTQEFVARSQSGQTLPAGTPVRVTADTGGVCLVERKES